MNPDDLRAWLTCMGYSQQQGADALDINRSALARMLAGGPINLRTAYACAAIACGIKPWHENSSHTICIVV